MTTKLPDDVRNWLYHTATNHVGQVGHLSRQALDHIDALEKRCAELERDLKDHRIRLAFSGREIMFGIKPDGTPSEASKTIARQRALLKRAKEVLLAYIHSDSRILVDIRAELERKSEE